MAELTTEQRKLLQQSGGQPVRLIDPDTKQQCILYSQTGDRGAAVAPVPLAAGLLGTHSRARYTRPNAP